MVYAYKTQDIVSCKTLTVKDWFRFNYTDMNSLLDLSGSVFWHEITGFQLDLNLLRTFCPSSPNFVRTFGNFLGHFFNTNFYHHKRKLPSALLKLKPGVVLLPFRMVSAVRLIVWLFIS